MRPVLHTDVIAAAGALVPLPPQARDSAARRLVAQADAADRYRKRMGRAHGLWGNGTLLAAAGRGTPRPVTDPDMLDAMRAIIEALTERAAQTARF